MTNLLEKNKVFINSTPNSEIDYFIDNHNISSVYVLVDENTNAHCLEIFTQNTSLSFEVIEIPAGEKHKHINTCLHIWEQLSEKGADRKSLLINLGGGVVTDVGGFAASCFRRGIKFVHVPTTLLAMVDAALGGKNGVDLNNLKNQIGVINLPEMILVNKHYLKTLPKNEIFSGFAEMLKHGLITDDGDRYFYDCLQTENFSELQVSELIEKSIAIKLKVVEKDINESGLRKILNYGHTLGHAIESFRMGFSKDLQLLHGEAIAIGLILESFISHKMYDFPKTYLEDLKAFVLKHYELQNFDRHSQSDIIELMRYDKKNEANQVNFVLLKDIGVPVFDCKVENDLIFEAFDYYQT